MRHRRTRYWGRLRGLLSIAFGIVLIAKPDIPPGPTFAAFLLADGVLGAVSGIAGLRGTEHWWLPLVTGLAGLAAGTVTLATLANPWFSPLAPIDYLGVWAMATGLPALVAAGLIGKNMAGKPWLVLSGLLSIAFGVFLMAVPRPDEKWLSFLIGAYALALGAVLLPLSFGPGARKPPRPVPTRGGGRRSVRGAHRLARFGRRAATPTP